MRKKDTDVLNYLDILIFYGPLFLNSGVMNLSTPFLNYGVGRARDPELSLAAFATSFSIMIILNSLIFSSRKVFSSHIINRASYVKIQNFFLFTALISTAIFLILGLTCAGDFLFSNILNTSREVTQQAKIYMVFVSPIPILNTLRIGLQTIVIVFKKTGYRALATLIRIFFVFSLMIALVSLFPDYPTACAALSFVISVIIETLFLLVITRGLRTFSTPTSVPAYEFKLNYRYILRFTFPIWISSLSRSISFSLINFFIGFTSAVESGLAGFGVMRSLVILANSPLFALATVVLILGHESFSMKRIQKFCAFMSLLPIIVISIFSLTDAKLTLLSETFNLSGNALLWANSSFYMLLFIPILTTFRSYAEGVFIKNRKSFPLGVTGVLRTIAIILSGIFILHYYPDMNGVVMGFLLLITGSLIEGLFMLLALQFMNKQPVGVKIT